MIVPHPIITQTAPFSKEKFWHATISSEKWGRETVPVVKYNLTYTCRYDKIQDLLLADELIAMFGGTVNEETFRYSREYFFYIALGMPFYMFGQAMNPVIRAGGSPRFAMVSTLAGAVINLVLDPIFIFVLHWGMMGAAALVLAEGFPRQLIALFGAANESAYYTEFAVKAFRVYLCLMVPACVNKACFIFLQAVGRALASTLLSMFREVVFGVGFALLLPVFFGLDGVLYSMPVSDALTFALAAVIIVRTYRELNAEGAWG